MSHPTADEETIVGEEPSEEEMFYVAWGDELLKGSLTFVNEVLRQMATLSAALLGGAIAFLDKQTVAGAFLVAALVLLFVSVAAATVGMLPFRASIPRRAPYEIQESIHRGMWRKDCALWISAAAMGLALLLLIIGVVFR